MLEDGAHCGLMPGGPQRPRWHTSPLGQLPPSQGPAQMRCAGRQLADHSTQASPAAHSSSRMHASQLHVARTLGAFGGGTTP